MAATRSAKPRLSRSLMPTWGGGGRGCVAVIALFAARRIAQARPGQPIRRVVFEGYRRGRRAKWLVGADWEALLGRPVEEIRHEYAVPPAYYYPKVIATLRQDDLLTTSQPATAMPA